MPLSSAENDIVNETTLLAKISDEEKPTSIDPSSDNKPVFRIVFNEQGRGVAYVSQSADKIHVVHNGRAGRPVTSVDQIVLSPDGRRIAYSAQIDGKWRMVIDNQVGVSSDEVGVPVFSPDSRHIAYEARSGEKWHIVVDNTMKAIAGSENITPIFSADSKKIAYIEKVKDQGASRLVVTDLSFKTQSKKESIGAQLLANREKIMLAAVKKSGRQQGVIEFSFDTPDAVKKGPLYDAIHNLAFGPDGVSLAYGAARAGKLFMVLNGKEASIPDGALVGPPVVSPDHKGVGAIMTDRAGYFLYQAFFQGDSKEKHFEEAVDLVYSNDGSLHAYTARKGQNWFVVVNGKEGPAFDRVVTPVFSPDGKRLVYRARKDGKRFGGRLGDVDAFSAMRLTNGRRWDKIAPCHAKPGLILPAHCTTSWCGGSTRQTFSAMIRTKHAFWSD